MTDRLTLEQRHKNMAAIRSKNTKPELYIRKLMHKAGLRYRLHSPNLPGKPDIVLRKYKTVIFVNGCFWHGHGCNVGKLPKSNVEYWASKIKLNLTRDKIKVYALLKQGWRVLIIWECALKGKAALRKRHSQREFRFF